jgi:hypothetical protein
MTGVGTLALEREARPGRTKRLLQALGRYFEPAAVLVTVPRDADGTLRERQWIALCDLYFGWIFFTPASGSYRTVDPPKERDSGAAG